MNHVGLESLKINSPLSWRFFNKRLDKRLKRSPLVVIHNTNRQNHRVIGPSHQREPRRCCQAKHRLLNSQIVLCKFWTAKLEEIKSAVIDPLKRLEKVGFRSILKRLWYGNLPQAQKTSNLKALASLSVKTQAIFKKKRESSMGVILGKKEEMCAPSTTGIRPSILAHEAFKGMPSSQVHKLSVSCTTHRVPKRENLPILGRKNCLF